MKERIIKAGDCKRHGQSMVEFALVVVMFFMIIMGILEVARLVFTVNALSNAAREGSHYLALHPELMASNPNLSVKMQISPTLFLMDYNTVQVSARTDAAHTGVLTDTTSCQNFQPLSVPLTITVGYTWTTAVRLPGGLGNGIYLTSSSTVFCAH